MKLKECLITGWICGMESVGESINNILHAGSMIFSYDDMNREENELLQDFEDSDFKDEDKTKDILENFYGVSTADLDAQLDRDLQ